MNKKGFFITVEGPEGAGKSTQVRLLADYFAQSGRPYLQTREPGGTPLAEHLRTIIKQHHSEEKMWPETELLLMEAARSQHWREVIQPALASGITVICDRFTDSSSAYQGGARDLPLEKVSMLNDFATGGQHPDLTLLLDMTPETGFRRIHGRESVESGNFDRFEAENIAFHHKVREAFLQIAAAAPERVKVIPADGTPEEIAAAIREVVNALVH